MESWQECTGYLGGSTGNLREHLLHNAPTSLLHPPKMISSMAESSLLKDRLETQGKDLSQRKHLTEERELGNDKLIRNRYPSNGKHLFDDVLATFVLHHQNMATLLSFQLFLSSSMAHLHMIKTDLFLPLSFPSSVQKTRMTTLNSGYWLVERFYVS